MTEWQEQTQVMQPIKAVLFADVSGWTEMCERLGNEKTMALVYGFFDLLAPIITAHGGREIKRIGDEIMCLFPNSGAAGHAARGMQNAAEQRILAGKRPIYLRIGFQSGPVLLRDGDCFGDAVNTAARIAGQATRGRIFTSREAASMFPPDLAVHAQFWRRVALKGKEEELDLFELAWREQNGSGTVQAPMAARPPPKAHRLTVTCQGQVRTLDPGGGSLKFGRAADNDLVIADPNPQSFVSSHHGQFERRGGSVMLVDTSRNGIHVRFGDAAAFMTTSGTAVQLRAAGRIAFGQPFDAPGAIIADFTLE